MCLGHSFERKNKDDDDRLSVLFLLQASLKERFDWEGASGPQWQVLEGGRPCTDCGVLVEGTALYFGGADARHAVTTDLDLRGAKSVFIRRLRLCRKGFGFSVHFDLCLL